MGPDLFGDIAGFCRQYTQEPAIVYQVLSSRLLGELYSQVLVLGIFAVFLGFLQEFTAPGPREGPIIKRLLLFMGVLLFASYVALTYTLEGNAKFTFDGMEAWWKCAEPADQVRVRVLLLALTPIDLLGVGLIAFLFVIIAQVRIGRQSDPGGGLIVERAIATTERFSLGRHLPLLYIATGLAHAMFCLWWYVRFELTGEVVWNDVVFHGGFTAAYVAAAMGNYVVYRIYRPQPAGGLFQWLGVVLYLGLTTSAYLSRTYSYFDKLSQ